LPAGILELSMEVAKHWLTNWEPLLRQKAASKVQTA